MRKISSRELYMLVSVSIIGLLFLGYTYYYKPLTNQVSALETQLKEKTAYYEQQSELFGKLDDLRALAEETERLVETSALNFYPQLPLSEYITKIDDLENESGVELTVISSHKIDEYIGFNDILGNSGDSAVETNGGSSAVDNTVNPEEAGDRYGLGGAEFQLNFFCTYEQLLKLMEINEAGDRRVICSSLSITPLAPDLEDDGDIYSCSMTISFLETFGLSNNAREEDKTLEKGLVEKAGDTNPFINQ